MWKVKNEFLISILILINALNFCQRAQNLKFSSTLCWNNFKNTCKMTSRNNNSQRIVIIHVYLHHVQVKQKKPFSLVKNIEQFKFIKILIRKCSEYVIWHSSDRMGLIFKYSFKASLWGTFLPHWGQDRR